MLNKRWRKITLLGILVVVLGLFPLYANLYYQHLLTMVFINIMLAVSLRLTLMTGQFNVSHPAFMALGAYGASIATKSFGVPSVVSLLIGGLIPAFIGLVIGVPTLRLRGVYFALVTIALVEVVRIGLSHGGEITGGFTGLNIPSLVVFGTTISSPEQFYWVGFILVLITVLILYRIEISRVGFTWKAISQSDKLAASAGVNTMRYKTAAFVIGNFFAGLAGAFYAYFQRFLMPTTFGFNMAVNILIFNYIGGMDRIIGPILGASFMTLISEPFRGFTYYETIFFAIALLVVIIFLPGGLTTLPDRLKLMKKNKYKSVEQKWRPS